MQRLVPRRQGHQQVAEVEAEPGQRPGKVAQRRAPESQPRAPRVHDPQAARAEIGEVSRVAREALAQVRRAVSGIRAAGIAAELASAKLLLETDGVAFSYRFDEGFSDSALPPGVESALALTVREAATNIQRHARAGSAEVSFTLEGDEVVLRIVDDGRGGTIVPGNGLSGMRERLEAVRGRLRVDTGRKGGTLVEARVPLAADDDGTRTP